MLILFFFLYFIVKLLEHVSVLSLDLILIEHFLVIRVVNTQSSPVIHDMIVKASLGILILLI